MLFFCYKIFSYNSTFSRVSMYKYKLLYTIFLIYSTQEKLLLFKSYFL